MPLDCADALMLQRHGQILSMAHATLFDPPLQGFDHVVGTELAHALHFVSLDEVIALIVIDVERDQRAIVVVGCLTRTAARRRFDERKLAVAVFDRNANGGNAVFLEQAGLADLAGAVGFAVDGGGQALHREAFAIPDINCGHW